MKRDDGKCIGMLIPESILRYAEHAKLNDDSNWERCHNFFKFFNEPSNINCILIYKFYHFKSKG